jgi:membrane protease YdiL (CAAX protease family)
LLLALAAPLAVLFGLAYLGSVWWTFAAYHAGVCLVAPLIESRLSGRGWRAHAVMLGLMVGPGIVDDSQGRGGSPRWFRRGIFLGLVTALATGAFLLLTGERFLDEQRLRATFAEWGTPPEQVLPVLAVVALVNAPAEELFWRGYFPGRVAMARPARPSLALTIVLPAVLYTSYHAATIGRLVGRPVGVAAMVAGVAGAGLLWGWLRQRTGSVWMPLLSHSGAVLAYLLVYFRVTAG